MRQIERGGHYRQLAPSVVVAWLVEPLLPRIDRLHSIFELRERRSGTLFGSQLAFHLLQLSHGAPPSTIGYAKRVGRWARFLNAKNELEPRRLASEDPIMTIAGQRLQQLSQDPSTRRLARLREDELKLNQMEMRAEKARAEADGRAAGMADGMATLLLRQLGLRFGPLPDRVGARVRSATTEELKAWADRVLTAASLDEVLGR